MADARKPGRSRDERGGGKSQRGSSGPSRGKRPGGRSPRDGAAPRSSESTRSGGSTSSTARTPRDPDRPVGPRIPDEITGEELDKKVAFELKTLPEELATFVARCLVATSVTLDERPEDALHFARLAKKKAGRVAVVREAAGMAEYMNGNYQEALNEFRAAKRMTGSEEYLPLMADCERGLGRPERALELAKSADAAELDADGKAELLLVTAGARIDMGQIDAAIVLLSAPAQKSGAPLRVRYAYADALEMVGRGEEATKLFAALAVDDVERETDADERAGLVDDVAFLEEPDDGDGE